jgi:predicted regulator of Ras-like GTPase activity (Roadblock/LC7/MglB family)
MIGLVLAVLALRGGGCRQPTHHNEGITDGVDFVEAKGAQVVIESGVDLVQELAELERMELSSERGKAFDIAVEESHILVIVTDELSLEELLGMAA